jgi:hypothetical protein
VEIEKIAVQASLGKKTSQTPISTNKTGVVVHACDPSCVGSQRWEDRGLRPVLDKNSKPYMKKTYSKKG